MKKLSCILATVVLLAACQSTPPSSLNFTAPPSNSIFNQINQQVTVKIASNDQRQTPEISRYVHNGRLHKISSNPTISQLFGQMLSQDLNAKGFRIGNPAHAHINVQIKQFFAKVEEGNLRHKVTANIQLVVQVQGTKGTFNKNIASSHSQEGMLGVNNNDIHQVLNKTLSEVAQMIYQDREISAAIHQLSR